MNGGPLTIDTTSAIWLALGVAGAVVLGILLIVYLVAPTMTFIGRLIGRLFKFIGSEIGDALRLIGALITALVFVPLALVNALIGRWSASAHYGRAIEGEGKAVVGAIYRLLIGNPARLLGLQALTEGIEQRVPQAMAAAPLPDVAPTARGMFDGWEIVGTLQGGGSGARLYIAKPSLQKIAALARQGISHADQVVIKSFSLRDGSTLPQIVRESRALPAAKRLGLILEHELTNERFYYITRYVPGESLSLVTQRMHAAAGGGGAAGGAGPGLDVQGLRAAASYAADLLTTLSVYHAGGLWHKDVKPDNVIVSEGRAHLVDFGLITPLRSSLTLTTHGTEYFRDPEMVRMALRGAKVHEVDGAKFDLYAVGAVLYAMIENSFPAHGGLSQISRRCPEALRWIVRRAMTDYDKRYETAGLMLSDVQTVLNASDMFAVRPADLPSFRAGIDGEVGVAAGTPRMHDWEGGGPAMAGGAALGVAGAGPGAPGVGAPNQPATAPTGAWSDGASSIGARGTPMSHNATGSRMPRLTLTNWWTGAYRAEPVGSHGAASPAGPFVTPVGVGDAVGGMRAGSPSPRIPGSTAAAQLVRARARMESRRARAQSRMASRRSSTQHATGGVNAGVWVAFFLAVGAILISAFGLSLWWVRGDVRMGSSRPNASVPSVEPQTWEPLTTEDSDNSWLVGVPDADAHAWSRAIPNPSIDAWKTGVLVLRDPASYALDEDAEAKDMFQRLESARFQLVGEVWTPSAQNDSAIDTSALTTGTDAPIPPVAPVAPSSAPLDAPTTTTLDPSTELAATLRREIGINAIATDEARAAIVEFLARQESARTASKSLSSEDVPLRVVLWFGRGEDGQAATWCVIDPSVTEGTRRLLVGALAASSTSP